MPQTIVVSRMSRRKADVISPLLITGHPPVLADRRAEPRLRPDSNVLVFPSSETGQPTDKWGSAFGSRTLLALSPETMAHNLPEVAR